MEIFFGVAAVWACTGLRVLLIWLAFRLLGAQGFIDLNRTTPMPSQVGIDRNRRTILYQYEFPDGTCYFGVTSQLGGQRWTEGTYNELVESRRCDAAPAASEVLGGMVRAPNHTPHSAAGGRR